MPPFGKRHSLLSSQHFDTIPLAAGEEPEDGATITWSAALKAWTVAAPAAPAAGGFTGGLLELTGVWLSG